MTVHIQNGGTSRSRTSAIDRVCDTIRTAALEAKAIGGIDLSHPEAARIADELRGLQDNVPRLVLDVRGPCSPAARAIFDGAEPPTRTDPPQSYGIG